MARTDSPQAMPEPTYEQLRDYLLKGDFGALEIAATRFLHSHSSHGNACHLQGFARLNLGDAKGARAPLEQAAALLSDDAEVWDHLGVAYNLSGHFSEAATALARSLDLAPGRAETWVNAGKNFRDMSDRQAAREAYQKALQLNPNLVHAHNNLSVVLEEDGLHLKALQAADQAIELAGEWAPPHVQRGNALRSLSRTDEAIKSYDRALVLDPAMVFGWVALAEALYQQGEITLANAVIERARQLSPTDPAVLHAMARVSDDLQMRLYWLEQAVLVAPRDETSISVLLFNENYRLDRIPAEMLALARRYGALLEARVEAYRFWPNSKDPDRHLRVGIVSPDFCDHPVAHFVEGFLAAGQELGIAWHAYSSALEPDQVTERLRDLFTCWHDVSTLSDAVLCERIRADQIDILIDLAGHTEGGRLPVFARKPAPVQVTWLGYSGTTGVEAVDYILGDPYVLPLDEAPCTTETPWRLPEVFLSFSTPSAELPTGEPPMVANGYPTFGCFDNLLKVNDEVLALWSRVLEAVPDSRLLLRSTALSSRDGRSRMVARLTRAGIDPARVELGGELPSRDQLLQEYFRIDISLDPFPYNGTTTSCESLWMGVPVLTMKGDRMISRVGETLNANLGMGEWVAIDEDDYVSRAVCFCRDEQMLRRLRKSLRTRGAASPLGNPKWFANQLAAALRGMWREWCDSSKGR